MLLRTQLGALTSGFVRPSLVGPCDEYGAIVVPDGGSTAPTATSDGFAESTTGFAALYDTWLCSRSPSNSATILAGSATVQINGKAAARMGDMAQTCNDPADLPAGTVIASGTVLIG